MANYRLQVHLPWDSGLPEDVTVNVWHCLAPDDAGAIDFRDNVVGFYQSIDEHLSNIASAGASAAITKLYNLADPIPRAPVHEATFTLTDATGTPLPPEVALCVSFQGLRVSGQPQARKRGRIYLGPLDQGVIDSEGRIATAVHQDVASAAGVLLAASGTWDWSVWSPTDGVMKVVTDGWVDNEFDIQRRRGRVATARTTFT